MKTHVDIVHPMLFTLRKSQLAKKWQWLMLIICNNKGRKGMGPLVDYEPLRLIKVYECRCFGHVMSKTC
jgi:hypothetical protein